MYSFLGCEEKELNRVCVAEPSILGFALARRMTGHTHVLEFTPVDKSFINICSWNAPDVLSWPPKNWILLSKMKVKKIPSRLLWKEMRSRGYWIWIGGKNKRMLDSINECIY